jgi:membrane protease subunit (stomatin/prohibitin family)
MSLADFVKKQFIDVIQWTEANDETLVWRFPTADHEIQQGAQLTVRETQAALFVDRGKVADLFGPGLHTIRTRNLPILTDLRHWAKAFESPFTS